MEREPPGALAKHYKRVLRDGDWVRTPFEPVWNRAVYHLNVVVCAHGRDELQRHLAERNIGSGPLVEFFETQAVDEVAS